MWWHERGVVLFAWSLSGASCYGTAYGPRQIIYQEQGDLLYVGGVGLPGVVWVVDAKTLTLVKTVSDMGKMPETLPSLFIPNVPWTLETLRHTLQTTVDAGRGFLDGWFGVAETHIDAPSARVTQARLTVSWDRQLPAGLDDRRWVPRTRFTLRSDNHL